MSIKAWYSYSATGGKSNCNYCCITIKQHNKLQCHVMPDSDAGMKQWVICEWYSKLSKVVILTCHYLEIISVKIIFIIINSFKLPRDEFFLMYLSFFCLKFLITPTRSRRLHIMRMWRKNVWKNKRSTVRDPQIYNSELLFNSNQTVIERNKNN